MTEPGENDRPQDVGRRRTRKGGASADPLIIRWHAELRTVLDRVIKELQGTDKGAGLDGTSLRELPSTSQTEALVRLGALAAKELGAALDGPPMAAPGRPAARPRPRARKADYGGA